MIAIALVMFGLGIALTIGDFSRALTHRKVIGEAFCCYKYWSCHAPVMDSL